MFHQQLSKFVFSYKFTVLFCLFLRRKKCYEPSYIYPFIIPYYFLSLSSSRLLGYVIIGDGSRSPDSSYSSKYSVMKLITRSPYLREFSPYGHQWIIFDFTKLFMSNMVYCKIVLKIRIQIRIRENLGIRNTGPFSVPNEISWMSPYFKIETINYCKLFNCHSFGIFRCVSVLE
jgi:hypothetical protein